ncbi:hypothetical protein LINPERHAP1_LOCUS13816 [Linum perenne]
MVYALLVP